MIIKTAGQVLSCALYKLNQQQLSALWSLRCQALLALLIIAVTAVYAVQFLSVMLISPLFYDEISTISWFSAQGAWHSMSHYPVPNNHILFNVLNALTPGDDLYHPLRARFWSIVAVIISGVWMVVYCARRQLWLEASLCLAVIFTTFAHLDITLQARGYGLQGLALIISVFTTLTYIEKPQNSKLLILATALLIGNYTVLSFIPFTAALLLSLWLHSKDARVFYMACGTALATLGLYWPVLSQVIIATRTFPEKFGRHFTDIQRVFDVLQQYLPEVHHSLLFAGFICLTVLAHSLSRLSKITAGIKIIMQSIILSFAIFLWMGTPYTRAVLFVGTATILVSILLIGQQLRHSQYKSMQYLLLVVISGLFLFNTINKIRVFEYYPRAHWNTVVEFIEQHAATPHTVFHDFQPWIISPMFQETVKQHSQIDKQAFSAGRMLWLEPRYPSADTDPGYEKMTLTAEELGYKKRLPHDIAANAVTLHLWQRGSHHTMLSFAPFQSAMIKSVTANESSVTTLLTDSVTDAAQHLEVTSLNIDLMTGVPYHHLEVIFADSTSAQRPQVKIRVAGQWQTLDSKQLSLIDRALAIPLNMQAADHIHLSFSQAVPVSEIWVAL